jgi:Na+/proline symporter
VRLLLSTPGQAYHDGMGFVQFYFGLPIAMIVICLFQFITNIKFTAYEYLEQRFDLKTRSLAAILFLFQRGLGTGLTIYAPAIILSAILGWNLTYMNIVIGVLVIFYILRRNKSSKRNAKQQMFVIMSGMLITFSNSAFLTK